ncbi:class II aldolase/adducin family protein [Mesorhizobium sp. SB112]|uniref:class II aldolase/adducin family protein n=1 Tax=Mesorhizobium sp. SB112 TaxID=3151853 RepID=UPI003263073B
MSQVAARSRPQDYSDFLQLSARLGSDITRTQGAGGNTSIKENGIMWVKASGTWLSQAEDREIMVPVEVAPLIEALKQGDPRAEKATDFVVDSINESGLRPSIETSFHAALPQAVVAHFHCVNTLALAVLDNGRTLIEQRLAANVPDLICRFAPYKRPGVPVALEILKVAGDRPDILVLANHGIIITADTVQEAVERIERVTAALAIEPRPVAKADSQWLEAAAKNSTYRVAADEATHATALDPAGLKVALGGSLYPDHVIFLGTEIGVLGDGKSVNDLLSEFAARGAPAPKMLVAAGKGVLLSNDLTPGGEAMARCLAEVVIRVPEGERIRFLTDAEEYELGNWEAEQYRQSLDRQTAGQ